MDEKKMERKKAILVSVRGVIYLVLVMVGIFGVTSLMKVVELTTVEQEMQMKEEKEQWEESKRVKECNSGLKLVEEVNGNDGIASLPLGMYLKVLGYENGMLSMEVDNQSGYKMEYREYFTIEFEEDGNWVTLGDICESVLVQEGEVKVEELKPVLLLDLTKVKVECDLNVLGELKAGKYRVLVDDMLVEFALEENE